MMTFVTRPSWCDDATIAGLEARLRVCPSFCSHFGSFCSHFGAKRAGSFTALRSTVWLARPAACLLLVALVLSVAGCATPFPRFGPPIDAALARSQMRKLRTPRFDIYYPNGAQAKVQRVLPRLEQCAARIEAHVSVNERLRIVMPDVAFNNAYVTAALLPHSVIPTYFTSEHFATLGLPPDPAFIACHELVHYVQRLQVRGLPRLLSLLTGPIYSPQIGLDPWFWEGLAVYYETKLQGGSGRLGSPYFNGVFAAAMAGRSFNGGMLSPYNRRIPHGPQYLIGSHFIDWLARTYGEDKLWELVRHQGDEVLAPIAVNQRFGSAFGHPLTTLIDQYNRHLQRTLKVRHRPAEQRVVASLGQYARYARSAEGSEVRVYSDLATPLQLEVRGPSGAVRLKRLLTDVVPPRKLLSPSTNSISGLSFTADDSELYFVAFDDGKTFPVNRLMRLDIAKNVLSEVERDLHGAGGSISPDGRTYFFARARGASFDLAAYDLAQQRVRVVVKAPLHTYFLAPRVSPDGTKLIAAKLQRARYQVVVLDAQSGQELWHSDPSTTAYTPSWIDNESFVYVAEKAHRFQVFQSSLQAGAPQQLTDAPYLALEPFAGPVSVRFLNRDGFKWTLDEVPRAEREDSVAPDLPEPPQLELAHAEEHALADFGGQPTRVLSDAPYSVFERLWIPEFRGLSLVAVESVGAIYGLGAMGGDMLGYHRWSAVASYQPTEQQLWGSIGYLNRQFAPLWFDAQLAHGGFQGSALTTNAQRFDYIERGTHARLAFSRLLWGSNLIRAGGRWTRFERTGSGFPGSGIRRLTGFDIGGSFGAAETTPYTGVRRALGLNLVAAHYPLSLSTLDQPLTDMAGYLTAVTPLPFSKLHTLTLSGTVRGLSGGRDANYLLQVGGVAAGAPLYGNAFGIISDRGFLPPGNVFLEYVRGYEDAAFFAQRYLGGTLTYKLPFIFDVGTATTLGILPASFFRQVDLQLFSTGGSLLNSAQTTLLSAGGSLIVRGSFANVPLSLEAQLSRRMAQDHAWTALILLGGF